MLKIPVANRGSGGTQSATQPNPDGAFGNLVEQSAALPSVPAALGGASFGNQESAAALVNLADTANRVFTDIAERERGLVAAEEHTRLQHAKLSIKEKLPKIQEQASQLAHENGWTPDQQKAWFDDTYRDLADSTFSDLELKDTEVSRRAELDFEELRINTSQAYNSKVIEPLRLERIQASVNDGIKSVVNRALYADSIEELDELSEDVDDLINTPAVAAMLTPEAANQMYFSALNKIQSVYVTKQIESLPADAEQAQLILEDLLGEDTIFTQLDADQRMKLMNYGQKQIQANIKELDALAKKASAENKAQLKEFHSKNYYEANLALRENKLTYQAADKLHHDQMINDDQHLSILKSLDAANKALIKENQDYVTVTRAIELGIKPQDKKAVNKWYNKELQNLVNEDPATRNEYLIDKFSKIGMIPDDYKNETVSVLQSDDPDLVKVGLSRLRYMESLDSRLVSDFDKNTRIAYEMLNAGMPPERFIKNRDAANSISESELSIRNEQLKVLTKSKSNEPSTLESELTAFINETFDPTSWYKPWTWSDEAGSIDPRIKGAYKESFKSYFILTGDSEVSAKMAQKDLLNRVGRTTVGGTAILMFNAPETLFRVEDNPEPLLNQIKSELKQHGVTDDMSYTPHFAGYTKQGSPYYTFTVKDSNTGMPRVLRDSTNNPVKYTYDATLTSEYKEAMQESEQDLNKAKADRKDYLSTTK